MLASKCARCGKYFVGWSLAIPENQRCRYCGSQLAIHDETIYHEIDYERLLQSIDIKQDEWQQALEKTLSIYLNGRLTNVTSDN
jgi:DNA-directed RNA polymerase subunit RPC12/RpoP